MELFPKKFNAGHWRTLQAICACSQICNWSTWCLEINYVVFKKFMEGLLKTDIPSKLSGSRNILPWIDTELKRQIRKKGRRFSKAKKSGLKEDWDNYKAMEKDVKCNLKRAEINFLQTILTTGLESVLFGNMSGLRLAPMWQQSGTLLFCSCHGIAVFLVDELQIWV